MRTKEHRTTQTRSEATQNAGGWLARFFFSFFYNFFITTKPINNFNSDNNVCSLPTRSEPSESVYMAFGYSLT